MPKPPTLEININDKRFVLDFTSGMVPFSVIAEIIHEVVKDDEYEIDSESSTINVYDCFERFDFSKIEGRMLPAEAVVPFFERAAVIREHDWEEFSIIPHDMEVKQLPRRIVVQYQIGEETVTLLDIPADHSGKYQVATPTEIFYSMSWGRKVVEKMTATTTTDPAILKWAEWRISLPPVNVTILEPKALEAFRNKDEGLLRRVNEAVQLLCELNEYQLSSNFFEMTEIYPRKAFEPTAQAMVEGLRILGELFPELDKNFRKRIEIPVLTEFNASRSWDHTGDNL